MRKMTCFLAMSVMASVSGADTIYLKNGVFFDGIITVQADGTYRVQAGPRTLIYRESEIDRIEKNDRTGRPDKEAMKARWLERDNELTRLTGLSTEQRKQVDALLSKLVRAEGGDIVSIRERFVALQSEMDVFRYLEFLLQDMSYILMPRVLEIICYLDAGRAPKILRVAAEHPYYGTREKALEWLGRLQDRASIPLIARGLLDGMPEVRIAAAYALANSGGIEATPVLIESLKHFDMRVANASREALDALWQSKYGTQKPRTVDEWKEFWAAHANSIAAAPIFPDNLKPLIDSDLELHVS